MNLAFIQGPARKVLALDLAKAKPRWTMEQPGIVLGIREGKLVVLVQDQVQALEPATGRILLRSESLGLEGWSVMGSIQSHSGQTFFQKSRFEGEELILTWWAASYRVSGIAPSGREPQSWGQARVNMETGRVVVVPHSPVAEAPRKEPFPQNFVFVSATEDQGLPPWLVNLKKSLHEVDNLLAYPSLDHEFVLTRIQGGHEAVDMTYPERVQFQLTISEMKSGNKLGAARIPLYIKDFAVLNKRLVYRYEYEQAGQFYHRELRALTLSGRKLWTYKLWEPPTYPPVP